MHDPEIAGEAGRPQARGGHVASGGLVEQLLLMRDPQDAQARVALEAVQRPFDQRVGLARTRRQDDQPRDREGSGVVDHPVEPRDRLGLMPVERIGTVLGVSDEQHRSAPLVGLTRLALHLLAHTARRDERLADQLGELLRALALAQKRDLRRSAVKPLDALRGRLASADQFVERAHLLLVRLVEPASQQQRREQRCEALLGRRPQLVGRELLQQRAIARPDSTRGARALVDPYRQDDRCRASRPAPCPTRNDSPFELARRVNVPAVPTRVPSRSAVSDRRSSGVADPRG